MPPDFQITKSGKTWQLRHKALYKSLPESGIKNLLKHNLSIFYTQTFTQMFVLKYRLFFHESQKLNETAFVSGYSSFLYESQARYFLLSKLKVWTLQDSWVSKDIKSSSLWALLMLGKKKSLWFRSYSELAELMNSAQQRHFYRTIFSSSLGLSISILLQHMVLLFLLLPIPDKLAWADANFMQNSTE